MIIYTVSPDKKPVGQKRARQGKKRGKKILIVDDDPTMAYLMLYAMEGEGHSVHWAKDAREALTFAEVRAPRMIFSDIEMPGEMNGLELAARLHLSGHRMPLWLMSGNLDRFAGQVESAMASGHARGFLDKPIEISALKSLARQF